MSSRSLPVKELDVIEVLPGCPFPGLVYSKGIVRESLSFMSCVVEFPADKRSTDGALMEEETALAAVTAGVKLIVTEVPKFPLCTTVLLVLYIKTTGEFG